MPFAKRDSRLAQPKVGSAPAPPQAAPKLFLCAPKPEPAKLEKYSRNSVNWCASQISDPIARLKFLKKTAPHLPLTPRRIPWQMIGVLLAAGTLASLASLFLMQREKPVQPLVVQIPSIQPATVIPPAQPDTAVTPSTPADVWQVEKTATSEVYSNGLRIDTRFTVSNQPRSYLAFPVNRPAQMQGVRQSEPAGIVFHTTESRQAPFEADQNRVLKKLGESLLEYVRRKRAYHFLIDRFGRVYRVVAETDSANHSGNSIWADDQWLYINLNQSFIGVSVEARTEPGQEEAEMSPAQIRSAAMLTEMLRTKYHIAAGNCVTHAQVSVNPSNMQIGLHVDWASSFPFEQIGLPDNYRRALPSLWASGFEYDRAFQQQAGDRIETGVQLAEERLATGAAQAGMPVRAYRKMLQKRYREQLEAVRQSNADESEESE